jgi:hypothetical protein
LNPSPRLYSFAQAAVILMVCGGANHPVRQALTFLLSTSSLGGVSTTVFQYFWPN